MATHDQPPPLLDITATFASSFQQETTFSYLLFFHHRWKFRQTTPCQFYFSIHLIYLLIFTFLLLFTLACLLSVVGIWSFWGAIWTFCWYATQVYKVSIFSYFVFHLLFWFLHHFTVTVILFCSKFVFSWRILLILQEKDSHFHLVSGDWIFFSRFYLLDEFIVD